MKPQFYFKAVFFNSLKKTSFLQENKTTGKNKIYVGIKIDIIVRSNMYNFQKNGSFSGSTEC